MYDCFLIEAFLASAMPLLQHNILTNGHLFSANLPYTRPSATVLDWDDTLPEAVTAHGGGYDIVMYALHILSIPIPYNVVN